jgi:hypothetical protein
MGVRVAQSTILCGVVSIRIIVRKEAKMRYTYHESIYSDLVCTFHQDR